MQSESNENNLPLSAGQPINVLPANPPSPRKAQRLLREKVSRGEIKEINARHKKILGHTADLAKEYIELGGMLIEVKRKVKWRGGSWENFVEHNLDFDLRTAQRYMWAFKHQYDYSPAELIVQVWGNKSKKAEEGEGDTRGKNDVNVVSENENDGEAGEGDGDTSQHGGPGFEPGLLPDRFGQLALDLYREFKSLFEGRVFKSPELTLEEKIRFAGGLIGWLEYQKDLLEKKRGEDV